MVDTSIVFDLLARDRASRPISGFGRNVDSVTHKLGGLAIKGASAFALLAGAASVFAYKVGSDYVASLNQIQALTGANNKQMDAAAKFLEGNAGAYAKMGQSTGDAAAGVVELTKSGLSLHQALQSVYGTMTLAKAGELGVADASSITANALNTFHLKAKQAGDVANYLANAANISSADVSDIAESFKYVAPVAASAGVSIQQTNAILAELANAGIKGSQAGTSLRTMLLNLEAPTKSASQTLKNLGVSVVDSSGNLKPFNQIVDLLANKLNKLPGAEKAADLKALFGKTGIAGAQTILANGAAGLEKYTKGVGRAGAATKLAESRSKGLAGSFQTIIAGAKSGAQSIYRQFSPIADKVIRPLANKFATFSEHLGPDIQKGIDKVHSVLAKMNITGIGKGLAQQAKAWAAPVIAGFNAGLNTGDWSGLGKALGNGIVKAAGALGDLSGKLGAVLGKIDWVGIGIDVGKQAPSFFVGLATGLFNFDLFGLLKGVGKHWFEVLLAVVAIAFAPAKIIAKVAELLARIPLAGPLLRWGLLGFKTFSDRMVGAAGDALRFLGKSFLSGFRRVFPEVGKAFSSALRLFPTRIGVMAIDVREKGLAMVKGLGSAIARGTGFVVSKIGELIARMIRPYANAGSWLISKGAAVVSGLLKGITGKLGVVISWARGFGGKLVGWLGDMGSVLVNAGGELIQGFISGITSKLGAVKGALGGLTSKLTSWKGPPERDRTLLTPAGVMLMEGLVKGIEHGSTLVKTALGKVTDYIKAQGQKVKSLLSARSDFASGFQSFTTSVFSTDLSHTGTDMLGNDVTTPASIADMLAYQAAQRTQARQLRVDVARLHKLGLSNALIKQLQGAGESGLAQIHTLAGGNRSQIKQLNALNKQTSDALAGAGGIAGGQLYNSQINQAQNNEDLAKRIAHHLVEAQKRAGKNEYAVIEIDGHRIITAIRHVQRKKGVKEGDRVK